MTSIGNRKDIISRKKELTNTKGAYLINSNTSRTVSISLLILGVIITTTSFIGCFGAHLEHTSFLNTYSSITAIALILELGKCFFLSCS